MSFGLNLSAAADAAANIDLDIKAGLDASFNLSAGLDLLASLTQSKDKATNNDQPTKAMIIPLGSKKDYDRKVLTFQFNPTQIKFSKATSWNSNGSAAANGAGGSAGTRANEPKRNVPTSEFQGGSAQTLSMDLLFDTTHTSEDVRKYTDKLVSLTLIDTQLKAQPARPALVKFVWGKFSQEHIQGGATRGITSFTAYVQNANINFTMFLQDGTPVRAEAQVTFTAQVDNEVLPFQNPTSRSESREMYVVRAGETLDYIAYHQYGDAAQWRHIAQANNLLNPKNLRPGLVLKLTPLPEGV